MTFDEAFNIASASAKTVTVAGKPRTWFQRIGLAVCDPFAPTPDERIKIIEAAREYTSQVWADELRLPETAVLIHHCRHSVNAGPLTLLWIAAMVVSLIANLRKLLKEN
jgi:hypothetical protein